MKKVSLIFSVVALSAMILIICGGFSSSEKEVTIGNQVWMAKNLNVDKFRNGDPIPHAKTDEEWEKAGKNKQPAWCYYANDPANGEKYGKLYNWYAVNDPRSLAPNGWHVPSDEEWTQLIDFIGGSAGAKMKSASGWEGNGNGNNESGFSGLPGGFRGHDGTFKSIGNFGFWWSSTVYKTSLADFAWFRGLVYAESGVYRDAYHQVRGVSVRCLRD